MMHKNGHTRIFLENITVELAIGYHDWEKSGGQKWPVRIDVDMSTDRTIWNNAVIEEIVDYDRIHRYLQTLCERPHVEFLETLAQDILEFCFQDAKICSARIRIAKPYLYPNDALAGIELCRQRPVCSDEISNEDEENG